MWFTEAYVGEAGSLTLRNCNKGFTLVELLIVVIVIAILASMAIPKFVNASLRGKESALRGELKQTRNAVDLFHQDTGYYPVLLSQLATASAPIAGLDSAGNINAVAASSFHGPYLSQIDPDPIDGSALKYNNSAGGSTSIGAIQASAGFALDGSNYATW